MTDKSVECNDKFRLWSPSPTPLPLFFLLIMHRLFLLCTDFDVEIIQFPCIT